MAKLLSKGMEIRSMFLSIRYAHNSKAATQAKRKYDF